MGIEKPVAPVVPPAPARYVQKQVAVPSTAAPAKQAKTESAHSGGLYVVAPGDTLSAISRRSGVSVADLARMNGISDPNKIQAGAKLRLSGAANPIGAAPRGTSDATTAAKQGAVRGRTTSAAAKTGGGTIVGASTGRQYVVGKIYISTSGVQKMAMPDGTFKRI
jgi:LysM repeat protein